MSKLQLTDLCLDKQKNRQYKLEHAIYELIMNAIDASKEVGGTPTISVAHQQLTITDNGNGITHDDFVMGRPSKESSNGQHGIGLKDAIAVTMRNNVSMTIDTVGNKFTFGEDIFGDKKSANIGYRSEVLNQQKGTTVRLQGELITPQLIAECKLRFIDLLPAKPEKVRSDDTTSQYPWPDEIQHKNRRWIYTRGVAKEAPGIMDFMYDIHTPPASITTSVDQNHRIISGRSKNFRKIIEKLNPKEGGWWPKHASPPQHVLPVAAQPAPTPRTIPPPQPSNVIHQTPVQAPVAVSAPPNFRAEPSSGEKTETANLYNVVQAALETQNHPLYTDLSDTLAERGAVVDEFVESLKSKFSVAEVRKSGSLPKHSALPGTSDADVVLLLTNFKRELCPNYRKIVEVCASEGNGFARSGCSDIVCCEYKGCSIDIILADKNANKQTDKRGYELAYGGAARVEDVKQKIGTNQYVYEVMRAVKLFVQRLPQARSGNKIKSFFLEQLVLCRYESGAHFQSDATKRQCLFYHSILLLQGLMLNSSTLLADLMDDLEPDAKEALAKGLRRLTLPTH